MNANASRSTLITHDGLLVRRTTYTLSPRDAERQARALNHLPTILEAWTQPIGRSERRIVCWIPASPAAQEKMVKLFADAEIARAEAEGPGFVWEMGDASGTLTCYNPRSRRTYRVRRGPGKSYACECARHAMAGTCKHVLDAILRSRFETVRRRKAVQ